MLSLFISLVVLGSGVWVYLDATNHKIGKIPGVKGFLNMSAAGWAFLVMIMWMIGFPLYLYKRSSLIELASHSLNEVNVRNRPLKIGLLVAAALPLLYISYPASVTASELELPKCGDSVTTKAAVSAMRRLTSLVKIEIKNPVLLEAVKNPDEYLCKAQMRGLDEWEDVYYTVGWSKTEGRLLVRLVDVKEK